MPTLHEKCPHPEHAVLRFGGRRRRCRDCGKTWSVHARRRGRKRRRPATQMLESLFAGVPTSRMCHACHCTRWTLQKRCQKALRRLAEQPFLPSVPDGPLVLIADAMHLTYRPHEYTLYNMAVKPAHLNTAFLLDPLLLPGRESARVWRQVFAGIPPAIRLRVKALVSDGLPGSEKICNDNGWIQQRCHFHMLAAFTGNPNPRHRVYTLRRRISNVARQAARIAMRTTDKERLQLALNVLRALVPMVPKQAHKLPGIIRRFIADLPKARAYLIYPDLGLPTTTAVLESLHSRIGAISSRIHSPTATLYRAACLVRLHPNMRCNPGNYQQN
jgi:hypothetical protein